MKGGQLARCVRDRERGGLVQNEIFSFSFFMSEVSLAYHTKIMNELGRENSHRNY